MIWRYTMRKTGFLAILITLAMVLSALPMTVSANGFEDDIPYVDGNDPLHVLMLFAPGFSQSAEPGDQMKMHVNVFEAGVAVAPDEIQIVWGHYVDVGEPSWEPISGVLTPTNPSTGVYSFTHTLPTDSTGYIDFKVYVKKGVNEATDSQRVNIYSYIDSGFYVSMAKSGRSVPGGTVTFDMHIYQGGERVAPSSLSVEYYEAGAQGRIGGDFLQVDTISTGHRQSTWTIPDDITGQKNYVIKAEATLTTGTRAETFTAEAREYVFLGLYTNIMFTNEPVMGENVLFQIDTLYGDEHVAASEVRAGVYDGDTLVKSIVLDAGTTGIYTGAYALPTITDEPGGINYLVKATAKLDGDTDVDAQELNLAPGLGMERESWGSFEWGKTYSWNIYGFFGDESVDVTDLQVKILDGATTVETITPTKVDTGEYTFSYTVPTTPNLAGINYEVAATATLNSEPLAAHDWIYVSSSSLNMYVNWFTSVFGETVTFDINSEIGWRDTNIDTLYVGLYEGYDVDGTWTEVLKENLTDDGSWSKLGHYTVDYTFPSTVPATADNMDVRYELRAIGFHQGVYFATSSQYSWIYNDFYVNVDVDPADAGRPVADNVVDMTFETYIGTYDDENPGYVTPTYFEVWMYNWTHYQSYNNWEKLQNITENVTEDATGQYSVYYQVDSSAVDGWEQYVEFEAWYDIESDWETISFQDEWEMEIDILESDGDWLWGGEIAPGDAVTVDITTTKNGNPADVTDLEVQVWDTSSWTLMDTYNDTTTTSPTKVSTGHYQFAYTFPTSLPPNMRFDASATGGGQDFGDYESFSFYPQAVVDIHSPDWNEYSYSNTIGPRTLVTFEGRLEVGGGTMDAPYVNFEIWNASSGQFVAEINDTITNPSTGVWRATWTVPDDVPLDEWRQYRVEFKVGEFGSPYQDELSFSHEMDTTFTQILGGSRVAPGESVAYLVELKVGETYVDADNITAEVFDNDVLDTIEGNALLVETPVVSHTGLGTYEVTWTAPDTPWRAFDYSLDVDVVYDTFSDCTSKNIYLDSDISLSRDGVGLLGELLGLSLSTRISGQSYDYDLVNLTVFDATGTWDLWDVNPFDEGLPILGYVELTQDSQGRYSGEYQLPSSVTTETQIAFFAVAENKGILEIDYTTITLNYYNLWVHNVPATRAITETQATFDMYVSDPNNDPVEGATIAFNTSHFILGGHDETLTPYTGITDANGKVSFTITYENTGWLMLEGKAYKGASSQRFSRDLDIPNDDYSDVTYFTVAPYEHNLVQQADSTRAPVDLAYTAYNGSHDNPGALHASQPIYYYIYNNTVMKAYGSATTSGTGTFDAPLDTTTAGSWSIDFESPTYVPNATDNPSSDGKEYTKTTNSIFVQQAEDEDVDDEIDMTVGTLVTGDTTTISASYTPDSTRSSEVDPFGADAPLGEYRAWVMWFYGTSMESMMHGYGEFTWQQMEGMNVYELTEDTGTRADTLVNGYQSWSGTIKLPSFLPTGSTDIYTVAVFVGTELGSSESLYKKNFLTLNVGQSGSTSAPPTPTDTDGDGISDYLDDDDDNDGWKDTEELAAGTDPLLATDKPTEMTTVTLGSPAELLIVDKNGKKIGMENGVFVNTMPGAVKLPGTHESYQIFDGEDLEFEVTGTANGTYDLTIDNEKVVRALDGTLGKAKDQVKMDDLPTKLNKADLFTVDWNAVAAEEPAITIKTDDDGDGTFETEFIAGEVDSTTGIMKVTSPDLVDSDGDHYVDSVDKFKDDPTEALDTDDDNIGNNADLDDDNDGIPDTWEEKYSSGLNSLVDDADLDPDGDGATNLEEYKAGTNPLDATSKPAEAGLMDNMMLIIIVLIVVVVVVVVVVAKGKGKKKGDPAPPAYGPAETAPEAPPAPPAQDYGAPPPPAQDYVAPPPPPADPGTPPPPPAEDPGLPPPPPPMD